MKRENRNQTGRETLMKPFRLMVRLVENQWMSTHGVGQEDTHVRE